MPETPPGRPADKDNGCATEGYATGKGKDDRAERGGDIIIGAATEPVAAKFRGRKGNGNGGKDDGDCCCFSVAARLLFPFIDLRALERFLLEECCNCS
jgi:hypothetical protein